MQTSCYKCGRDFERFRHECPEDVDSSTVFGCPEHDDSCFACFEPEIDG
jgi:hypothetical protein